MMEVRRALPFLSFVLVLLVAGCSMLPPGSGASAPGATGATGAMASEPVATPIGQGGGVTLEGLFPSAAPRDPLPVGQADLDAARAAWTALGARDYWWQVRFGCECMLNGPLTVQVADGTPTAAAGAEGPIDLATIEGFPLTIDALFDAADDTLTGGGTVRATFAPSGIPLTLFLDRDIQAADDELGVTVMAIGGRD